MKKARPHAYNGKAAEYKVVVALLERGFNTWFPALESTSIDLICNKGAQPPIRLQVKSCTVMEGHSYKFSLKGPRARLKGEADFFVLVTKHHMLIRPAREVETKQTVRLSLKKFHNPNWELLEEFGNEKRTNKRK